MKRLILFLFLLPLFALAQAPTSDSTRLAAPSQSTSLNSFYVKGSNASNAQFGWLWGNKWMQLLTGYQFNNYTGTSTQTLLNGKAPISGSANYVNQGTSAVNQSFNLGTGSGTAKQYSIISGASTVVLNTGSNGFGINQTSESYISFPFQAKVTTGYSISNGYLNSLSTVIATKDTLIASVPSQTTAPLKLAGKALYLSGISGTGSTSLYIPQSGNVIIGLAGAGIADYPRPIQLVGNSLSYNNGASIMEFWRTDGVGAYRASVGGLGSYEANLSSNMDYTTSVHRLYDNTKGAAWIGMGENVTALQYSKATAVAGDIWNATGARYLFRSDSTGRFALNTFLGDNFGDAQLYITRRGVSGIVTDIGGNGGILISGDRRSVVASPIYLNLNNTGSVYVASGGGKTSVGGSYNTRSLNLQGSTDPDMVIKSSVASGGVGTSTLYLGDATTDLRSYFSANHQTGNLIIGNNGAAALTFDPSHNATIAGSATASIGAGPANNFVVSNAGLLQYRTAAQVLSDIGAAPATGGSYLPLTAGAGSPLTGTLQSNVTSGSVFTASSATTGSIYKTLANTGTTTLWGIEGSAGGLMVTGSPAYSTVITSNGNTSLILATNGVIRQTISGAGATTFSGTIMGTSLIKSGGTSAQFLKADGSVDATTYMTNPMTTNGNIIYGGASGAPLSLTPGFNNTILHGGTTPSWGKVDLSSDILQAPTYVVNSSRFTSQTAAQTIATYTVGGVDASFLISANVLVTASTTHNFTMTCTYTDEGNTSRVLTLNFSQLSGTLGTAITNTTGVGPYEGIPVHIRAKTGTTITMATTGTFTTVTYNAEATIRLN